MPFTGLNLTAAPGTIAPEASTTTPETSAGAFASTAPDDTAWSSRIPAQLFPAATKPKRINKLETKALLTQELLLKAAAVLLSP